MDEFLNFAIAILMYVLAIIHLAIFENRSEQSLFSRTDFWRNIYRVKLHIYLLFPAIYFFRYLIVLKKKIFKLFWRYMRGNSSPFCRDATFKTVPNVIAIFTISTQSYIFGRHFCQFGHLWMIISAVYRGFHEKKIEFFLPLLLFCRGYFLNKNFPKKCWTVKLVHCLITFYLLGMLG